VITQISEGKLCTLED